MDTSNWRHSEGESSVAGGSSVEPGDWRDQLQTASRNRIVNKIMDTLKRHLPFTGDEGLQELNRIAVRFENKIHTAASSQSDYLRKISLKMLTMETRSQIPLPDAIQPNPVTNGVNPPYPVVASPITVRAARNKKTWTLVQDEKLVDVLMELHASGKYKYDAEYGFKPGYFQAVQNLLDISLPNSGLKAEPHIKSRVKKLKSNFCIVHEMLVDTDTSGFGWDPVKCCVIADDQVWDDYLQTHKSASHFRDKSFPFYDKLFIIFGKDRAMSSRVVHVEDEEEDEIVGETQESTPIDLEETDIAMGVQLIREGMEGTSSKRKRGKGLSLDSMAQTSGDWQEEVYQKIKAMKDLYLLDLNDLHQKIVAKLQKHESVPQRLMNEQVEKLRIFKNMLERFMQFLQVPKHGIVANYKDKLPTYERQIVDIISSNRRKAAPTQH